VITEHFINARSPPDQMDPVFDLNQLSAQYTD
jgi:hypothetical protein